MYQNHRPPADEDCPVHAHLNTLPACVHTLQHLLITFQQYNHHLMTPCILNWCLVHEGVNTVEPGAVGYAGYCMCIHVSTEL